MVDKKIDVLGLSLEIKPLHVKNKLPLALSAEFDLYEAQALNKRFLLLQLRGDDLSIQKAKKHMKIIQELLGQEKTCVLWLNSMTAARRERLIENHIPFIVDERMVFLPFLGMQIEEQSRQKNNLILKTFTIATQCVFLSLLYQGSTVCSIVELMNRLHLSKATVARALQHLSGAGLLTVQGKATRKRYYRIDAKQFWEQGKQYLQNPVIQRFYTDENVYLWDVESYTAGEEALSNLSMIQTPQHKCRAIYKQNLNDVLSSEITFTEDKDYLKTDDYSIVEIWKYDPGLFADSDHDNVAVMDDVDLFSLYLSLGPLLDDVRIETEMDNLMEEFFHG